MSPQQESEPLVQPAPPSSQSKPSGGRRRGRSADHGGHRRAWPIRIVVRLIATAGIVGIGVAIAAIMNSSHSQGWLIGLVVAIVAVVLEALLWSSRLL